MISKDEKLEIAAKVRQFVAHLETKANGCQQVAVSEFRCPGDEITDAFARVLQDTADDLGQEWLSMSDVRDMAAVVYNAAEDG